MMPPTTVAATSSDELAADKSRDAVGTIQPTMGTWQFSGPRRSTKYQATFARGVPSYLKFYLFSII